MGGNNRYKYILWDHDGVLVDTEKYYFRATQKAMAEFGVKLSDSTYLEYMALGKSCWTLIRNMGVSEQDIRVKKEQRNEYYRHYLQTEDIEIDHVLTTLKQLSANYRMAIVTTSRRRDFQLIHEKRSITSFMDFVLDIEDYEHAKPHPDPYMTALNRFGAKPSEAVVIEDTSRGLASAIAAGIDCLVLNNPFT